MFTFRAVARSGKRLGMPPSALVLLTIVIEMALVLAGSGMEYQMHASAPERSWRNEAGYVRKSSMIKVLTFGEVGWEDGRGRRERTTISVSDGLLIL